MDLTNEQLRAAVIPPFPPIPSHWHFRLGASSYGATARFFVSRSGTFDRLGQDYLSIYFDAYNRLGSPGHPYWELYPIDGDTKRFGADDTAALFLAIDKALEQLP